LNYASITPSWINVFNQNYVKDIFHSKYQGRIEHNFMIARNETFGYYDTPYYQVLEMKSKNNLSMGIILGEVELTQKLFDSVILNLQATTLAQVKIPIFKIQTKLRYTNIMKQTDLKTVFLDLNVPELFTSTCKLDDVIQNIEIIIDRNTVSAKANGITARIKTVKEFNADTTFIYYLRQTDTNCILFVGSY
jgi:serine protease inhibitor